MKRDNLLIIGAHGQIGAELTTTLRKIHGDFHVVAADLAKTDESDKGPYEQLDILDKKSLSAIIARHDITQIYHLAAKLSATGEKDPAGAWNLNMQGLLNVLELAREKGIRKVFWPSSIAVFGPGSPCTACPQNASLDPTTVYGISKAAGEGWCSYYHKKYGVDIRSLRYPGLISYKTLPGGGTTDYAVEIFYEALKNQSYTSFLSKDTRLPMMYMTDAIRATLELMAAPSSRLTVRTSYNVAAMSFTPEELTKTIRQYIPGFTIHYQPDYRQAIADSWPGSIDDSVAVRDWGWDYTYGLAAMAKDMLRHLSKKLDIVPERIGQLAPETYLTL